MTLLMNPRMSATFLPPVMEARRWIEGVSFPADRPLINVSQAAPVEPPPQALREVIAEAALTQTSAHLYGPVLGLPELRAEIASQWSAAYGGPILPAQVAITQGCNQAFTAVMATLAGDGDEVILPTPWYF
ncbi:aminotransferase class I/II-fold pyridoxal phosphate-dependent enzyme, partial [Thioclava sp. BHET1]